MRKSLLVILWFLCLCVHARAEYVDHRGHDVDSLEVVMAAWTADDMMNAGEQELRHVADDLFELMSGFNQVNRVKSEYYARMLLGLSKRMGWAYREQSAAKNIGQHFWAQEKYDSAAFYYGMAMKAVERMSMSASSGEDEGSYSQDDIDDALSQMYGTLGNLYSMMDSIDVAMDYYERAGVLFDKHGWNNSSSILYYNMGETMRYEGDLKRALTYYKESLDRSLLTGDSLAVATAYKGLGSLYMELHRTSRAMRYLEDANRYFADHEAEELQFRMESLDYTGQVLALQKRRLAIMVILMLAFLFMTAAAFYVHRNLKKVSREKGELEEVLEETVESIAPAPVSKDVRLKPKEREVLDLIAKGYTNVQIAEAMSLSPDTIKWYKKKLFAVFDASNSAELVTIAKDEGLL